MGTIRTLLALAVVFAHTAGFLFVGGKLAVQLFYVISGFLISYILVERASYPRLGSFYLNRFLRLYPVYAVVVLGTLAMYALAALQPAWAKALQVHPDFAQTYREVGAAARALLVASNALIVGQDWVMFSAVHDGALHLATDFRQSEPQLWRGLVVPQAWTLGVEISFYLIAPWLLRRRRWMLAALAASLAVRAALLWVGLGTTDPWTYRFFPAELALFLAGALAHQVLRPWYRQALAERLPRVSAIVTGAVFAYCLLFFLMPWRAANGLLLIAVFVLCLPLLFEFQARHAWDSRIGNLSYPIYIVHMALIAPVTALLGGAAEGPHGAKVVGVAVALATIVAAYLLDRHVAERVEALRADIKRRAAPAEARAGRGEGSPQLS